jgi:GNAT superfamily N-acetyltransferase
MPDAAPLAPSIPIAVPAHRIHLASSADVPFIVDAIVAESRAGHFGCDCGRPDVLRGLWHQIRTVVSDGVMPLPGERNGAGARAFVIQVARANAGFAILVEDRPGSWFQRLELHAMSVHPGLRSRGLGRHLVGSLLHESRSARVYARCAFASVEMAGLLVSCGFEAGAPSGQGVRTLEFRRAAAVPAQR